MDQGNNHVTRVERRFKGFRVAVDNQVPYSAVLALKEKGYELVDGYSIMCMAHNIKNEDELRAMTRSIRVAELGIRQLKEGVNARPY